MLSQRTMTIITPGILTTVQDTGRAGFMDTGFSPSGCLDGFSARLANFLVANSPREAVLEMTLCGAAIRFDSPAAIALTGADMRPLLNGKPMRMNSAVAVEAGDILYTTFAAQGVRCYLAVAGGLDIDPVLGSRSTNLRCRLGGFKGRKLESKDVLPLKMPQALPDIAKRNTGAKQFGFVRGVYSTDDPLILRVVQGLQSTYFIGKGIDTFYNSMYTVQADSDRMGIRLEGPAVESKAGTDIVSDGIALGAIQIPGSGKPIVLLHDRQTTGGYAKIGAVITSDVWRLVQTIAGSAVRFERITMRQAQQIYARTERQIEKLRAQFIDTDKAWVMSRCC